VGVCLKGADAYVEGCPPSSGDIYQFLLKQ
jgi:coenzyme F420-reducing hydrogenase gamma subunit